MKVDAYSILTVLSVLVVLSYLFGYLSEKLRIPSVMLLIASGIGLKYAADYTGLQLPPTRTLLEILGVTGLIFIVLEASLDLSVKKEKLGLILRALFSALALLGLTSGMIAFLFAQYFEVDFRQALLHAIPLSVISSAIAIPSVQNMAEEKKEFIIYESTFSDILGIIMFNTVLQESSSGLASVFNFSLNIVLIIIISIISTAFLVFLLNKTSTHVRFFLTFAILIIIYSLAKSLHLPSLLLVLCFGLVLCNFRYFDYPVIRRFLSFERLGEATKELKLITAETAFVIRTFFFLLFGYAFDLHLLASNEVLIMGGVIIVITLVFRYIFLRFFIHMNSAPLMLIAPRGLITIILFYSIPETQRMANLSEGVLFIVIVFTSLMMTVGLMLNKQQPPSNPADMI